MTPITFIHLAEVDSTNTYLMQLPRDPEQPYIAVHADFQTAGRGQRGNTWHSARGENLLGSIRHHPTFIRPDEQFVLSQLIALTITDVVAELIPPATADLRIKWPNDIYWRDRKLCGILIEYELSPSAIEQAIIGFGLNVHQTDFAPAAGDTTLRLPTKDVLGATFRPISLQQIAEEAEDYPQSSMVNPQSSKANLHSSKANYKSSIFNLQSPQFIPALFRTLTERYVAYLTRYEAGDTLTRADIDAAYTRRLYRLGIPARYRDAQGDFTATLEGVNPDGTLRLRLPDDSLRRYEFKEVAYVI